jgi:hypothetical protein
MKTGKLIYVTMILSMLFLFACSGGGGGSDDETSNNPPVPEDQTPSAPGLTVEQAQNALYAVYGGIGYSKNSPQGNSLFYDVMVDNINSMGFDLILKTIYGDNINIPDFLKIFTLYIGTSSSYEFKYSNESYTSTLAFTRKPKENGYYGFDMSLAAAFNGTGYTYGTSKVYGTGQASDFTVNITGNYNYNIISGVMTVIIRSVKITAGNGLKNTEAGVTTTYNNWELAYTITYGKDDPMGSSGTPTNLGLISSYSLISGDKTYLDFRDYTLKGSFTINDKKFSFSDGFRYEQKEYAYSKDNKSVPYIMISANGSLCVPGLDDPIAVSSTIDTSNPDTNGTIIASVFENSTWSTDWLSGTLKFTTSKGDTSVIFDNGSVRFADSWTVDNWRTALDPLK